MPFPIAAVMGVANFASGALSSFGEYQNQQNTINAQNNAMISQYKQQLKMRKADWARERALYGQKINNYNAERFEQDQAFSRAMEAEQSNLNEIFKQARFSDQSQLMQLVQEQGANRARGVSGRTSGRMDTMLASQFGRNQAIQAEELTGAVRTSKMSRRNAELQLRSDARRSWANVAVPPMPTMAPLKPTLLDGPSGLGLATGLLSAGISGYNTYDKLTPSLKKGL